jgi:hypothetical protein
LAQPSTVLPLDREEELSALDDLAGTIEDNARDDRQLARHLRQLRAARAAGREWHTLVDRGRHVPLLELSSQVLRRAREASVTVRRRLAVGLRAEGATIPAIAEKFGVSHQRVSTLLRNGGPGGGRRS